MDKKVIRFQEEIARAPTLQEQLHLHMEWVAELQKSDVPAAIEVCRRAIALARRPEAAGGKEGLGMCLFQLAALQARSGNYLASIATAYDAMPHIERLEDRFLLARVINVIAAANGYLGNYYEALNHFMKALEIFREIDDPAWEAAVLNNIGYQYWHLENHTWALKYLNMSLSRAETLDDPSLEGDICETLCNVYHAMGDDQQALTFGLRSMALYHAAGDGHGEAEVLNTLGDSYTALQQPEKALGCFRQALQLSRDTGHRHEEVETLLRLGGYHSNHGPLEEAEQVLRQALDLAGKLEVRRTLYECHRALAALLKKMGRYQDALEHHEQFFLLYRQVFDENQSLRIQSMEIMHRLETAEKDSEIYRLKNMALQSEIDERKKAQEALRELAITDPLTGLFNRRHFFELFEEACRRAAALGNPLAVILMDVDKFKQVNDQHGHTVGDAALVRLARILQESVRKVDVVARYGGEEFLILLPDTGSQQARDIAERLRTMVGSRPIQVEGREIRLGVSLGLAVYAGQRDLTLETLLSHADLAMYAAKQAGGNQVRLWEEA